MFKQVTLTNKCLAIVMQRQDEKQIQHRSTNRSSTTPENGFRVFQEFQDENRSSFWNPGLVQSINALEFVGFVRPGTLFVSGSELHLECLRGAWARRVLKPPPGFNIKRLGDIGGIEMQEVPQTQFIPLPEVLCLVVSNLNRIGEPATLTRIIDCLSEEYDGMCIPKQEVLYATLGALIAEGKLYCMGEHYFIPTPTMYQYYQQQFCRRNGPNPPTYLWTKEQETTIHSGPKQMNMQTPQETCSRECQTGASVVCGQPPYVPQANKKDQATNAKSQNLIQPVSNSKGENEKKEAQECKKNVGNKENKGFLNRLFGRSKPKQTTDDNQKRTKNDDGHGTKQTSQPSNQQSISDQTPVNVPVATFSAQFPPPEWLCDPRFLKTAAVKDTNQHQQQAFLSKIRRTSKEPHPNADKVSNKDQQQRHSVWVDPIEGGAKLAGNFNRRERNNNEQKQRHFASQRYQEYRNQYGHLSPNENYERYHRKQRNRLSKYLSSSSECLREMPYQNQKKSEEKKRNSTRHYHDRFQQQQHYSVYQFPQRENFANDSEQSTPKAIDQNQNHQIDRDQDRDQNRHLISHDHDRDYLMNHDQNRHLIDIDQNQHQINHNHGKEKSTLERRGKPTQSGTMVSRIPPLTLPTDPEFDSVSECTGGQRTSTPTPVKKASVPNAAQRSSTALEPDIDRLEINDRLVDNGQNQRLTIENGQRDSAYSVSPVVTELSSSDGKYSSWSGSDGHRENCAAPINSPESIENEKSIDRLAHHDNTYVNDTQARCYAFDHTYQNLDGDRVQHLDGTKYENISAIIEKPIVENTKDINMKAITMTSSIHAYVSSI